jgi:carbonic anhydrase
MMLRRVLFLLTVISLSGCAMTSKRHPTTEPEVVLKDANGQEKVAPENATVHGGKELTPIKPTPEAEKEAAEIKTAVAAAAKHIQDTHETSTPAPKKVEASEGTKRVAGPVPAEKSLGWLKNGNARFISGRVRADGARASDRKRLALGQKPHAVILSCSDSRVPPEVVFDQKLGEIFVIRTAGQALGANVIGSIEYAVEHLGANLIVVMGHESCGAVNAALASLKGTDLGSPSLNALAADIKPRIAKAAASQPSDKLIVEEWANVNGVARDLIDRSEILRDAVQSGDVKIERALYHLESGTVEFR